MATGRIANPLATTYLAGLSDRATDRRMSLFVPYQRPAKRDVGYVTKAVTFRTWLVNGTGADVMLSAIDRDEQAEGIEFSAAAPRLVPAHGALRQDITVQLTGPLEFEALVTFLSACGLKPTLLIVGTRAPQLSGDVGYLFVPHNWADGLDESLAWLTDVMVAHDRTEQRVQLRTMPRRAWDLRLVVAGDGRRKLETWLGLRKTRYLFSPVWRDETRANEAISAGASVVHVDDPQWLDFAIGRWLAVYDAWDHFEIRQVTGIGAGYVAVDAPFDEDWPAGSLVAPCRYGVALEQRRVSRFTEEVGDYRLRFEARNESLMPFIQSPDTYRGVLLCPFAPSWVGDAEETMDNKWVRLDNETGAIEFDVQSEEPVLSRSARFLLIGRADIDLFLRFLFYCAGRLSPFWVSATDRGVELSAPALTDATAIVVGNIAYEFALQGSASRTDIEMVATDGTVIRRRITGVETLPTGEERLTLDGALPINVSAASLNRCAWLQLCRLDSDSIDLKWHGGDCLEVTVPIVVLP